MKNNTKNLVIMGLLIAIVLIMSTTPLGTLPIGPLSITLNMIPIAIAAIAVGPVGGLVVGGVFGSSLTNYATLSNVLGKSGSVLNNQGDIIGGEYHSLMIHNIGNGNINGGIWHTNVYNQAAINGGDFKASVLNQANGVISGGHFAHLINSSGGKITNLSSNNVDLLDNIGGSVDNCSLSNIVNKNGIILNTKANKIDAFSHEKHGITKNIEAGDLASIQAKEVNAHDGVAIKSDSFNNQIDLTKKRLR